MVRKRQALPGKRRKKKGKRRKIESVNLASLLLP